MKTLKSTLSLMALAAIVFACGPKGSTVETSDAKAVASAENATTLTVNTDASQITWIGSKPAGQHNGTIDISSGELSLNGTEIVAGKFTIDISSLKNLDMAGSESAGKLEGHLMSADFFDEANYPEASFEVTGVSAFKAADLSADKDEYETDYAPAKLSEILVDNPTHFISGNLTMRGTTKNITFPASVSIEGGVVKAAARFNIDRTEWGLMYGDEASAVDKAKDKFLYNTVQVGFELEASEAAAM
jgi:polyisoprenoid-binding protein YceI